MKQFMIHMVWGVLFSLSLYASSPNVILVITDDQGYGDLSCHGNPILKTPALDALYAESTRLTDFHVSPTCAPTRGALMSGHFANRAGPWHTIMGRSFLKEGATTLAEVFAQNGYVTGMFGKWHLGDNYPFRPEDRGFQETVYHRGGGTGQTPDYWDNAYFNEVYMHNGEARRFEGYCTDVFFMEAKRFIQASSLTGNPFFAYISTNAPHSPFHCPDEYWKPYEAMGLESRVAVFYGMIANIDDRVGDLRRWLKDEGLAENTIFIFMTDNGTATGETVFNAGMRGKKASEYDGGHRVPFFIHWPKGGLNVGRDVDRLTAHVDILPTLLDLCGLTMDYNYSFDGRSLIPLLFDIPTPWPDRVLVTDSQRVVDPIKWRKSSVMTEEWRLVNGKELYAIKKDPGQKQDLGAEYPEMVERLREAYELWWASMVDSFSNEARIIVGHPAENPSHLTAHDWIIAEGQVPWHQSHIRSGAGDLGHWALEVEAGGEYEITIARWPREAGAAIDEAIPSGEPVPGLRAFRETPGVGFDATQAIISLNGETFNQAVHPGDREVSFDVVLESGRLNLGSWFENEIGEQFSAYYAYVERVD